MCPILYSFGPIQVFSYGALIALGLATAFIIIKCRGNVYDLNPDALMDIIITTTMVGIVSARILYVIRFYDQYAGDILAVFRVWEGGLIFYGGAIGAIAFLIGYSRITKRPFPVLADAMVPYFALVHGFGRIGCFLNGCCYGKETDLPMGVTFPHLPMPVHPVQLYSAVFCFMVSGILFYCSRKGFKQGALITFYFLIYPVGRFLIEFFRVNPPVLLQLSHAQVTSVVCFVIAVCVCVAKRYWER